MKNLIGLGLYAFMSIGVGALLCILFTWKFKKPRWAGLAAFVFFGGPIFLGLWITYEAERDERQFKEDVAYVKELCAKYGGDKIYRTVDNVEGVFQVKARNPDGEAQWRDQFGMVEPWALAFGDRDHSPVGLGTRKGQGYWFVEQHPGFGKPPGPPFRRRLLTLTTTKIENPEPRAVVSAEGFALDRKEINVTSLMSLYGYTTEDLTTPELRKRWISGGKLKIIDLQTNEVLAERTDFYRATGPSVKMAWSAGIPCPAGPQRLATGADHDSFIMAVLRPPRALPTQQQLSHLKEE